MLNFILNIKQNSKFFLYFSSLMSLLISTINKNFFDTFLVCCKFNYRQAPTGFGITTPAVKVA